MAGLYRRQVHHQQCLGHPELLHLRCINRKKGKPYVPKLLIEAPTSAEEVYMWIKGKWCTPVLVSLLGVTIYENVEEDIGHTNFWPFATPELLDIWFGKNSHSFFLTASLGERKKAVAIATRRAWGHLGDQSSPSEYMSIGIINTHDTYIAYQ